MLDITLLTDAFHTFADTFSSDTEDDKFPLQVVFIGRN